MAAEAAYSLFHFHRIFLAATGEPLKTYIRKRRLTLAARALIDSDAGIIDIALDAGFESQEAFTRAFKKMFGLPPGRFRKQNHHYPSRYKNRFTMNPLMEGGRMMTPEIREKKGFKLVGFRYFGTNENNEIPQLWDTFMERSHEIGNLGNPSHFYGVCKVPEENADSPAGNISFEYVAGREVVSVEDIPEGMVAREVPDGKYAVFTHRGSLENLKATYGYIYGEWAGNQGPDVRLGNYDFEFYNERFDPAGSKDSEMYIYVPLT
ncbi:MAG: effector binding domain-containing protein [Desulfobacterales bacterium]|nr:effector binding domain-containing protein [Desulfobacterales bacterium]